MIRKGALLIALATLASTIAAADDPPPFGTVMQELDLRMSGIFAGAGITWRQDSGRFYLADQHGGLIWSCDPFDPPGSLRQENWVMPNVGTGTTDILWSIAWDGDSGCFWISDIVDGDVYGGCYYIRIRRTAVGDTWRWFSENPGDTWQVSSAGDMLWMAGSEKWQGRDSFACMPVTDGGNNAAWKFDPYTKTGLGRCRYAALYSERGLTLVPWDSSYILTSGWRDAWLVKRDSTGFPLDTADGQEIADIALWVPESVNADDTVFMYSILNLPHNILQKRSVGLLWGQLSPGQAIGEPGWPIPVADDRLRIEPNPCRGFAALSFTGPLDHSTTGPLSVSLFDASGRRVLHHSSFDTRTSSFRLDLRSMPAGVYVLRLSAGTSTRSENVVLQH